MSKNLLFFIKKNKLELFSLDKFFINIHTYIIK